MVQSFTGNRCCRHIWPAAKPVTLIDDSLKTIAEKEVGSVVPADFIFTQTRAELIQAGLLLNDTSNLIQEKKAQGGDAEIEGRILSAVFF